MSKSFTELNDAIIQWAFDRNLIEQPPLGQIVKSGEELHELVVADYDQNQRQIIDAIGDVQVTILVYCAQRGIDPVEAIQRHYNVEYFGDAWAKVQEECRDCGGLPRGVKAWADWYLAGATATRETILPFIGNYYDWLLRYCAQHGYHPLECLEHAYEVIRDRSGQIVGGRFVKA